MKKISVYLYSLLLILLQVTVMSHLNIANISYGFGLVSVVTVSVIFDKKTSIINSVVCGILCDLYSTQHYGAYLISFFIIGILAVYFSNMMYKGTLITNIFLCFFYSLILEIVFYYVFCAKTSPNELTYVLTHIAIPQAFINGLISTIVFGIFKPLFNKYYKFNRW